jgi:glycine amidinotransferase
MGVSIYTEWGELKEVIVGDCFNIDRYNVDLSFRLFFHENIKDQLLKNHVGLQKRLVEQRAYDLDQLAETLKKESIVVKRPEKLKKIKAFTTPEFSDHLRPVDNPRDQTLIYGDTIIETPCTWRARYFENHLMKDLFIDYMKKGARWISAPKPMMKDGSFDLSYLNRDEAKDVDWDYYDSLEKNFEVMFDGAQCLKFGKDIVMNISNVNHKKGMVWLQRVLGDKVQIHEVNITDHHIDGMLMPLRPGLLLINEKTMENQLHKLPKGLQNWDTVQAPSITAPLPKDSVALASENISVNVLPLSEKKVMVFGRTKEEAAPLAEILESKGFECTAVQLRHSRLFGGGLHCATLDTIRVDSPESYF